MYLSRVQLDQTRKDVHRELNQLGAYHGYVEAAFPQDQGLATRTRHLWRIDYLRGRKYLLVVSKEKPDPSALGRYGVPGTVEIRDYDPFLSRLQAGHIYRFRDNTKLRMITS